ncbi:MAG TPA: glycosyltransferase family 4 protein [Solirubrobacteraceae bacterium]
MRVLTLAAPGQLPQARTLSRSLKEHQPGWSHEVLLMATEKVARQATPAGSVPIRSVCEELDLDIEALLALHDGEELAVLMLPRLLGRYSQRSSEPVIHLPSSVWVLGDLAPIERVLSLHGVMLTPRLTEELPEDGLEPTPERLERAGRIEPTIMGVVGSDAAEEFLTWWQGRVEQSLGALDARRSGDRPEDRPWLARFLELAPARFETGILDDPGCNLSIWNLHLHQLEPSAGGVVVDGRWPLRFLNLTGYEPDRPHRLNQAASRARVSRAPILHDLSESYARELRRSGWRDPERRGEVGRRLADGLVYDDALRSILSSALAMGEDFGDIFSEQGTRAFTAWLEGPSPRGAAHGINRYLFHRVARERPDVVRAYPDLDGPGGAEFVAWSRAFGRDELDIPDRFMPSGSEPRGPSPRVLPREDVVPPRGYEPRERPAPSADGDALGVRLTGYLGHTLGLGAAARGYARALGAAGVPVRTVTVPLHHLELPVQLADEYGRHGFEDLSHDGEHGFEIIAVNADELPDFVTRLGDSYFQGPRIGIWGWETNSIPPRWQRAFSLIDEIWVYSRFMAENIGAVAPVPVVALPPPVEAPADPVAPLRLGVPDGYLFLFIFDYLSTVQRKNPVGLIEAFRQAFPAADGPQLLIKTINAPLRPLAEEEVLWAAHGRPDIHVVDRSLSAAELDGLMAACDCYVSLHRAEGFGLTMAEAMAIGKPVIATGYSGNVDFMNSENSYLIDYEIGRVGAECEIYPPEGEWADPSIEHAAELMRRVLDQPDEARARGGNARTDVSRLLSAEATGHRMRRRLEHLAGAPREHAGHVVSAE